MKVEGSIKDILSDIAFDGEVFFNETMKKHTTLRIGGPADVFVLPKDAESLRGVLIAARSRNIPVMPVGGGSNILVADEGIEGLVISLSPFNHVRVTEDTDELVRLSIGAGTPLQKLVNLAKERGYKGMEGLAGIPGLVGGAVYGNAGAFGYEIGNITESVSAINYDGNIFMLGKSTLSFGYRSSSVPDRGVILGVDIRLEKDDAAEVAQRTNTFFQDKLKKQPISERSAGCVFKNPEGGHAGKLIDEAQCKGMKRGDIEVSSMHANFFINRGGGKASDFLALMEDVKERVLRSFGIELEPEIRIVGRK